MSFPTPRFFVGIALSSSLWIGAFLGVAGVSAAQFGFCFHRRATSQIAETTVTPNDTTCGDNSRCGRVVENVYSDPNCESVESNTNCEWEIVPKKTTTTYKCQNVSGIERCMSDTVINETFTGTATYPC